MRGTEYLAKLTAAGFRTAEILGPTGYATSRFTAGHYIVGAA